MEINKAEFKGSFVEWNKNPASILPEFAFIGRSNVGKSSLINMLCKSHNLAKVSQTPGKTQTINYFEINDTWYLVDLPGYGYARVSQKMREKWQSMIYTYLKNKQTLVTSFVLIDITIEPQKKDLEFIAWLAEEGIPFSLVFTKSDRIGKQVLIDNIENFKKIMLEDWENLPPMFTTSAKTKTGKSEILSYISEVYEEIKHEFGK